MRVISQRVEVGQEVVHTEEGVINNYTSGKLKMKVSVTKEVRSDNKKGQGASK